MLRRKLIIGIIVIAELFLGGCSLQTKVPPTSKYLLNVPTSHDVSSAIACRDKVLRIGLVESPDILTTRDIVYRTDSGRSYSYTKARWMSSINAQLGNLLSSAVTRYGTFGSVIALKSFADNDLLLETEVQEFSQTIHPDGTSTLKIAVKFVLLEQYHRNIVASSLIEVERDGVGGNVDSAVENYSVMVTELLERVNAFLDANCL